ncbi:MAG: LPP20 family lipoprotein [Pseudomonadota bacterium]
MKRNLLESSFAVGLLLASCRGAGPVPPPATAAEAAAQPPNALQAELAGAPDWVRMGCAAYFGEKKDKICGVGAVSGMTNVGLARSAAQGRGRTEIARSLAVRVKSMLKDYQAGVQGGAGGNASNEQYIEDTAKQITDMTLSGTRLQDMWISNSGTMYALMVLDFETFKNALAESKQLDERIRAAIVQRAERSFRELDEATEGRPAQPGVE